MQSPYIIDVHNNVDVVFLFCFVLFFFFKILFIWDYYCDKYNRSVF